MGGPVVAYNKTSTGPDQISYRVLKEADPAVVSPITTLFNLFSQTQTGSGGMEEGSNY